MSASTTEMLLYFPILLAFLIGRLATTPTEYHGTLTHQALFVFGGLVTGLPLLWFTEAAKRIPLTQLGFFQYIAPIIQFSLAVAYFGERFQPAQWLGFGLIWVALGIYSADLLMRLGRWNRQKAALGTV